MTCSWRFLISNKLEHLEFKRNFFSGFRNMQEKLEKTVKRWGFRRLNKMVRNRSFFYIYLIFQEFFSEWKPYSALFNVLLRIARNLLETRENIKTKSHSFYHIIVDWFLWESSKKIIKKIFFCLLLPHENQSKLLGYQGWV